MKFLEYSYLNFLLIFLFCLLREIQCWEGTADEFEIFDAVEEVNQNFYDFMKINHNATNQEIKRAFRGLSIQIHPDKSDAEDANIQFRNLVSIYEILKDKSKREKYDKVLKEGLPNWRSAIYYYRRYKKMGLAEGALILFVIITIGQYFFAWAAYLEKIYTAEQIFGSKIKKLQKKNKTNIQLDSILNEIPYPSIFNTLPFQLPKFIWNIPKNIKDIFYAINDYKEEKYRLKKMEEEEIQRKQMLEEEALKERQSKKEMKEVVRKRKEASKAPTKTEEELAGYSQLKVKELNERDSIKPVQGSKIQQVTGGFWTDDDLTELIHLVKKYPGGSSNRWEIIAEAMNRSVTEVTFMAAKLKDNGYRLPGQTSQSSINTEGSTEETKKQKTKKDSINVGGPDVPWTQLQQKALESAITQYRKNTSGADRWQKISNCVPGKTKEECLQRYKYLVDKVKSQKQNETIDNEDYEEKDSNENICDEKTSKGKEEQSDDDDETISKNQTAEALEEIESKSKDKISTNPGGKPKNKRKERKKNFDYYDNETDSE